MGRLGSSRTVFQTKWFEIEELDLADGDLYYRFNGPDAVVVFALTVDGKVVLVRQHRPARNHSTVEIPAGAIETGETPQQAARRELREETGFEAGELHHLATGGLRLDRDSSSVHTFAAFDCRISSGSPIEAGSEVVLLPLSEFRALVQKGRFEQLGALSAVLQALLRFGHKLAGFWDERNDASNSEVGA